MYYLSKEKKKELEEELKQLIEVERLAIAEKIAAALDDSGNMAENADFMAVREEQEKLEIRIKHLEDVIKNAEIVKNKKHNIVEIGATVIVLKKSAKKEKIFKIVGREEFDILSKEIPIDAPLAKAMLGKKEGEKFEFITPNGKTNSYTIKKVY